MTRATPLHERIGADIEARIMSGDWRPGYRIPVEHELMARYGCARMTVSKALSRLAESGLIDRRKRAGTFVAVPRGHRALLEIPDIAADIRAHGEAYRLELRARSVRTADATDFARMAVRDSPILDLACVHFSGTRPYAFEHRLINLRAVPAAASIDFGVEPPGSWLLGHVPWTAADHRIAAVPAEGDVAEMLAVAVGTACLSLERWTWHDVESSGSAPAKITYVRQIFPGNGFSLVAHFAAG